jgi:hypothetical protein
MNAEQKIQFWIPSDQHVPTDFWLIVENTKVRYEKIKNGFQFEIYESNQEKANEIVCEIITQILIDHDETQHGVSWRTVSIEEVPTTWIGCHVYDWHYRVRDSY